MTAQDIQNMPMQTPTDLFAHKLSDIRSAEDILAQVLQQAEGLVQDPQLKQDIHTHYQETIQQGQVIDQIFETMGLPQHPVTCHAAAGLQQSLKDGMSANPSPEVLQGLIVGGLSESEGLEIAAYEGLITKAQAMGQDQVVSLLQQNLQQEQTAAGKMKAAGEKLARQMASAS
ncbi:MAG TPA: DUF892 family protein [Thermomicrobiales bacterium]|jgi:ferritin-like metal-binding protein YciE|nr:DUF892 family protein [Thermomicrobiales bacterium]